MNISKYLYVTISLVTNFLLKTESNSVWEGDYESRYERKDQGNLLGYFPISLE